MKEQKINFCLYISIIAVLPLLISAFAFAAWHFPDSVDVNLFFICLSILVGFGIICIAAYAAWDRYLGYKEQLLSNEKQNQDLRDELKKLESRFSNSKDEFNKKLEKLQAEKEPRLKSLLEMVENLSVKRTTAYNDKGQLINDSRIEIPEKLLEVILAEFRHTTKEKE